MGKRLPFYYTPKLEAKQAGRGMARRSSIGDVAKRAGVSIATVSRIVNGIAKKASPETMARVRAAIAETGYRPTGAGQALRKGHSRLVAVLAANLANPTMAAIAASVEAALRDRGLAMMLCDTHDRADLQDEYLLETRAQSVRACVLLAAVASDGLRAAMEGSMPLVFVNRRCPLPGTTSFVGIDNRAAGRAVARELAAKTPKGRLAAIHGPLSSSATADRIAGFKSELAKLGRAPVPGDVVTAPGLDHLDIGYAATTTLLSGARPAGIFCASDLLAYGASRRLREAGLHAPRDVRLIGFDDNPLNDWIAPFLSSVRVPYVGFGRAIAETLAELWAGAPPAERLLPFEMIARSA
jgi:LacI family transcriptional regulator